MFWNGKGLFYKRRMHELRGKDRNYTDDHEVVQGRLRSEPQCKLVKLVSLRRA
jgi:hypothetical protein